MVEPSQRSGSAVPVATPAASQARAQEASSATTATAHATTRSTRRSTPDRDGRDAARASPRELPRPGPTPDAPGHTATGPAAAPRASSAAQVQLATLRRAWPEALPVELAALPANGNRPVAVYVPAGFRPELPATLVTYFHGHRWDVGGALEAHGVFARLAALGRQDPQTLVVLPQAGAAPFVSWMSARAHPPESLAQLEVQALALVARRVGREVTVAHRIVDAHSGGNRAVRNAAQSGELVADKLNLLDAAYGTTVADVIVWAERERRAGRPARVEAWFTTASSEHVEFAARHATLRASVAGAIVHDVTRTHEHNAIPRHALGSRW